MRSAIINESRPLSIPFPLVPVLQQQRRDRPMRAYYRETVSPSLDRGGNAAAPIRPGSFYAKQGDKKSLYHRGATLSMSLLARPCGLRLRFRWLPARARSWECTLSSVVLPNKFPRHFARESTAERTGSRIGRSLLVPSRNSIILSAWFHGPNPRASIHLFSPELTEAADGRCFYERKILPDLLWGTLGWRSASSGHPRARQSLLAPDPSVVSVQAPLEGRSTIRQNIKILPIPPPPPLIPLHSSIRFPKASRPDNYVRARELLARFQWGDTLRRNLT